MSSFTGSDLTSRIRLEGIRLDLKILLLCRKKFGKSEIGNHGNFCSSSFSLPSKLSEEHIEREGLVTSIEGTRPVSLLTHSAASYHRNNENVIRKEKK